MPAGLLPCSVPAQRPQSLGSTTDTATLKNRRNKQRATIGSGKTH